MLLFLKVFVCKKSFGKNAEQRTKPKLGSGSNVLSKWSTPNGHFTALTETIKVYLLPSNSKKC
jgi:hypothetical protein